MSIVTDGYGSEVIVVDPKSKATIAPCVVLQPLKYHDHLIACEYLHNAAEFPELAGLIQRAREYWQTVDEFRR
jgi:hypothetical protein